jgi:hypothetical protein
MKKVLKISSTAILGFALIGLLSACSEAESTSQPETTSAVETVADSESYKVGYDLGVSGSIGQMIFYGQAEGPSEACSFVLDMSVQGTTNDGIDWASLDQNEYLDGCMAGQLVAHPDADWNN